jgi:hypothetical protein
MLAPVSLLLDVLLALAPIYMLLALLTCLVARVLQHHEHGLCCCHHAGSLPGHEREQWARGGDWDLLAHGSGEAEGWAGAESSTAVTQAAVLALSAHLHKNRSQHSLLTVWLAGGPFPC